MKYMNSKLASIVLISAITLTSCGTNNYAGQVIVIEKDMDEIFTEEDVVEIVNDLKNRIIDILISEDFQKHQDLALDKFKKMVRFIDGSEEIYGYTFDSLSEETKLQIIDITVKTYNLLVDTYDDFYISLSNEDKEALNNGLNKVVSFINTTGDKVINLIGEENLTLFATSIKGMTNNIINSDISTSGKALVKEKYNEIIKWANN